MSTADTTTAREFLRRADPILAELIDAVSYLFACEYVKGT